MVETRCSSPAAACIDAKGRPLFFESHAATGAESLELTSETHPICISSSSEKKKMEGVC